MARYPAVIKEYNAEKRTVRIEAIGLFADDILLPEAELEYNLGDKSKHTEIEILVGDAVWIDFINDDPRYPIVTGYRNPLVGNSVDWRKWHHKNIELNADDTMILNAKKLIIEADTIQVTAKTSTTIDSKTTTITSETTHNGNITTNGEVSANGVKLSTHKHVGDSMGMTQPPIAG